MATVDVITPAYNASRYLPASINSVMAQTFQDWRILIVDDGSKDNTAEIVAPFIEQLGPRLKYIQQANGGPSSARNNAIRQSTAEYLAFLDADDLWLPNRLTASLKCFQGRPEVGLSYGLVTAIDPEGRTGSTFAGNANNAEGRIAPSIYMRRVDLPCCTVTLRRRCIEEVGCFDETMNTTEDRDLWLRIALKYEVACVPEVIAYYRRTPNSLSTSPIGMLETQLKFIRRYYGAEGCGLLPRQIALARAYKQRAEALKSQDQPFSALKYAVQALANYPLDFGNSRTAGSLLLNYLGSLKLG